MKITLHTALAALVACVSHGFGDDTLPAAASERPAPERAPGPREAVLVHERMGAVFLGFNSQGRLIAYDSARRVFELHDLAARNAPVTGWNLPADGGRVFGGALSADRKVLATLWEVGRKQSRVQLWNALTGEKMGPAFAPSDVAHVAFSPDGKTLAGVVALDGTVRVWDAASGELLWSKSLPEPMQTTWTGIGFSPDGRHLATRQSFGFSIWNVTSRQVVPAGERVFYLAISPNWKLAHGLALNMAAGGPPRAALMDITDAGKPIAAKQTLPTEIENTLETLAFSPDGRALALAMRDQSVRVWDMAAASVAQQTPATEGRIIRLLFSPDNRWLATYEVNLGRPGAMTRGKVRLWDVGTGQPLSAPHPHPGTFWDWQFDPDSRYLVVSFLPGDDSIHAMVWKLPVQDEPPSAPQPPPHADS